MKTTIKSIVDTFAPAAVKSVPGVRLKTKDIGALLKTNSEFYNMLPMSTRKDSVIDKNKEIKTHEVWERYVRFTFEQSKANIEYMYETHGIQFDPETKTWFYTIGFDEFKRNQISHAKRMQSELTEFVNKCSILTNV